LLAEKEFSPKMKIKHENCIKRVSLHEYSEDNVQASSVIHSV